MDTYIREFPSPSLHPTEGEEVDLVIFDFLGALSGPEESSDARPGELRLRLLDPRAD
jgi:hypothetical protein